MHYHLEIIMPPTDDIQAAVDDIMKPFNEQYEASVEEIVEGEPARNAHPFWDWYVLGGRWAGTKLIAKYDSPALEAFTKELDAMHVTVSSFQAGKQEIDPPEQIPAVDALWRKHFPDSGVDVCPMFKHSNNQYGETMEMDICKVSEIPAELKAAHVIIAGRYAADRKLQAMHMYRDSIWNGVTWQDTDWDRKVHTIIAKQAERIQHGQPAFLALNTITDDWLAVTVDYHS